MEVSYGIGVTNRYALFYDENEDPMEALKSATQDKEQPASKKTATIEAAKQPDASKSTKAVDLKGKDKIGGTTAPATAAVKKGPKESQPVAKSADQIRTREDGYQPRGGLGGRPQSTRGDRGGRFVAGDGQRVERNNRRNEDRPPREFGSTFNTEGGSPGNGAADGEYRPRGNFRGTFRGRGVGGRGAGGRGGRGGKREFDRQSGSDKSGVKAQEKRDGSGAHNWGSVKDEIEGQMEPSAPAEEVVEGEAEPVAVEATEPKEGGEQTDEVPAVPLEEEPVEYTLDEWKAKLGERKKPEFNIRKPGEGEDNSQWKKTFVLEKKKEEEEDEEDEIIDVSAEYPQRVGRQKFLDIDIRFADSRRGTRGGRGIGRGRGGERGVGDREGGFRGGDREGGAGGFRGDREGFRGDREGGFRGDRGDREGGYRGDREGGYRGDREGGYRGDREGGSGGYRGDREGAFRGDRGGAGGEREASSYRGGAGYRGGRGSNRGTYANRGPATPTAPKVDDEKDFPALG